MSFFKFPTIRSLTSSALTTFMRFPFVLLSAATGVGVAIWLAHYHSYPFREQYEYLFKVAMCCSLGLELFLSAAIFSESRLHTPATRYSIQAGVLGLLVAYYFSLPPIDLFTQTDIIRYVLFMIGAHLLVAVAPFIGRGEINGFWQFNKSLFIRILTAALYTGVLYGGLALALLAVDQLFKVSVSWRIYSDLWWILAGMFNTWFFLAGVPANVQELDTVNEYPKGLKIFTQFVLLPLVTIYLAILYAYAIKIVIQMELPKGWVSNLVLCFSGAGILSLLLIYPIRNEEGNAWIRNFSRWFYRALYPLIVLLGLSIYKRVSQYGITENRYFILLLALWLAAIATYFLISKVKNIKVIPISLCLMAFLSSFGPWGAFSISYRSQLNRLENLLTEAGILVNGKVRKVQDTLSYQHTEQINSIVRYLDDADKLSGLQPWFNKSLDSLFSPKDSNDYVNRPSIVLDQMGVEEYYSYYGNYREEDGVYIKNYYFYSENNGAAVDVKGYDLYYPSFYWYHYNSDTDYEQYLTGGDDSLKLKFSQTMSEMLLKRRNEVLLKIELKDFIKRLQDFRATKQSHKTYSDESTYVPADKMFVEAENDSIRLRINFANVTFQGKNDTITINNANAGVLYKRK